MGLAIILVEDGIGRVEVKDYTIDEYDPEIQRSHQQVTRGVMVPASSEAIMSLLKKSKVTRSDECRVCLEEFHVSGSDGDDANCIREDGYSMPCGHMFHQHCIITWLLTNHVCPLCRNPLPTNDH
ncbi:E3 ubiquitin-protein ligase RING1-like [Lotus japonicus]|uniref:E3 ubiquitin-protein ligase RING1-like n=1 Tax=Lotus japonicus TaxID=34305 RepID=UPI002585EAD2|nr:E3 ubiquitin-protein ligase RING1-like [Lotus japonicus]